MKDLAYYRNFYEEILRARQWSLDNPKNPVIHPETFCSIEQEITVITQKIKKARGMV